MRGDLRSTEGRIIGVRGGNWRGIVDPAGAVVPLDGGAPLRWAVAAEDRWYLPESEPSRRQRWYAGTPVAETKIRVPSGDLVSRVWCAADLGGVTVLEFDNQSSLPLAIGLSRDDLLTTSPPSSARPSGIEMPGASMVVPVGHRATARAVLLHSSPHRGMLTADIADAPSVVRGWESAVGIASVLAVPDHEAVSLAVRARCDLLLADELPTEVHALVETARLNGVDGHASGSAAGEIASEQVVELVVAAERLLRRNRRARVLPWDVPHLLANIARLCIAAGEEIAVGDIAAGWLRLADTPVAPPPASAPDPVSLAPWLESILVRPSPAGGRCTVFPAGIPRAWWGQNLEFRGLTADPRRTLSAAVRWHGERPALLWEADGPAGATLDAGGEWCTTETRGETLLPAPVE